MFFDKVIEMFSPQAALSRLAARKRLGFLKGFSNSGYDESGASRSKNAILGWDAISKSPQEDIDKNLFLLRQRCRSLYMSAPIAVSALKVNRTNIVGLGLKLRPAIDADRLAISHSSAMEWNKKVQAEFSLWADSKLCDSTRVNNFYEMQQVVCLSWLLNGDAFGIVKFNDRDNTFMPYGLNIHLIESDKVSTPDSFGSYLNLYARASNGNRIYNGVEIDDYGAVVAYHVCNSYPNSTLDTVKSWNRVEAFNDATGLPNVLFICETDRPEQYRGVPYLAPVIEALKQLTRYSEAEIMAAVINGFFTVFVTSKRDNSDSFFGGIDDDFDAKNNNLKLGPGLINFLDDGEGIEMADPKRPSSNYASFTESYAKYIGAALEIPAEILMKSFNNSYSASKAAIEEAWKAFSMRRAWLANDFCQPVYEIFLYEAIAKGRIDAPGFFLDPAIRKAYCKAFWNGPAKGMLDPLKEVKASEVKIKLGLSNREIEIMEQSGSDFESNVAQLIRENKILKEAEGDDAGGSSKD